MIKVNITENDILKCLKNMKEKPYEIALCRALSCEIDKLEIKDNQVVVWLPDDSTYVSFSFINTDDKDNFYFFMNEWDRFENDLSIKEFTESSISFYLDEDHSLSAESKYWTVKNFSYDDYGDEIFCKKSHKKHFDDEDF